MSEFKTFQSVRVIGGDYKGKSGMIQESVTRNGEVVAYLVAVKYGAPRYVSPENLVDAGEPEEKEPLEGKEIDFDLIRKGDKIRTVREFEDGFTLTMEGVAYRQRSDGAWVTVGVKGHCVAPKETGPLAVKQTHILVERQEPKDWFVFSRSTDGGPVSVQSLDGRTEKDAKDLAKGWNDAQKPVCGFRTVFWAAKAGK